jgi:flagellar biosynthesis component FlhA
MTIGEQLLAYITIGSAIIGAMYVALDRNKKWKEVKIIEAKEKSLGESRISQIELSYKAYVKEVELNYKATIKEMELSYDKKDNEMIKRWEKFRDDFFEKYFKHLNL